MWTLTFEGENSHQKTDQAVPQGVCGCEPKELSAEP